MKPTVLLLAAALSCLALEPWKSPSSKWTEADAQRILSASPWARRIPSRNIIIRWESARPVQAALERINPKRIVPDDRKFYAVAVIGAAAGPGSRPLEAVLKATGRPVLSAYHVETKEGTVLFFFSRASDIAEPVVFRFPFGLKIGNNVEFRARIGDESLSQTFSLKNMTYMGKAEL